ARLAFASTSRRRPSSESSEIRFGGSGCSCAEAVASSANATFMKPSLTTTTPLQLKRGGDPLPANRTLVGDLRLLYGRADPHSRRAVLDRSPAGGGLPGRQSADARQVDRARDRPAGERDPAAVRRRGLG